MNKTNLDLILNEYIARFEELNDVNGNDEGYKWRAESEFKANWDIDADDFAKMFNNAMPMKTNLINNGSVQPLGGISLLLKNNEVDFVRNCFRELFTDDNGDLFNRQGRIDTFIAKMNEKIEEYSPNSWKYPQRPANVIYYLNLWRPDDNYIYKYSEADTWASCIEFGDDFGSGKDFSLFKYYKMCDELLGAIKDNETLIALNKARTDKEMRGFDDKLHILVWDIIYCNQTYILHSKAVVRKDSTQKRVERAEHRAEYDKLVSEVEKMQGELDKIGTPAELPDLKGMTVKHKKYKDGVVVGCGDGKVNVDFKGEIRAFAYPEAFINGFLSGDNSTLNDVIENNKRVAAERVAVSRKMSEINSRIKALQDKYGFEE